MKISIIALLLILIMLFACTENTVKNDTPSDTDASSVETEKADPLAHIKFEDFGGYNFNMLIINQGSITYDNVSLYVEEETFDNINDAAYLRNRMLEEKFNITFSAMMIAEANMTASIRNSVNSADNAYDIVCPRMTQASALAADGYLLNLNNVPNIDMNRNYWDQDAIRDSSLAKKLYMLTGDLMTVQHDCTYITMFNLELYNDLGYTDNLYEVVRQNKWTYDKFYEIVSDSRATADLNGDGVLDREDRFGNMSDTISPRIWYVGNGEVIIGKDKDDLPFLPENTSKKNDILSKVVTMMYNGSITIMVDGPKPIRILNTENVWTEANAMFAEGNIMFRIAALRGLKDFRAMNANFGVLPVPMYDTNQPRYNHLVGTQLTDCITIPSTAPNAARTGLIVEAMAAASTETVLYAFYDRTLVTKLTRDEDSVDMLDIIFSTRIYDPGITYNFGGIYGYFVTMATDTTYTYERMIAQYGQKIQSEIDTTIEKYLNSEN